MGTVTLTPEGAALVRFALAQREDLESILRAVLDAAPDYDFGDALGDIPMPGETEQARVIAPWAPAPLVRFVRHCRYSDRWRGRVARAIWPLLSRPNPYPGTELPLFRMVAEDILREGCHPYGWPVVGSGPAALEILEELNRIEEAARALADGAPELIRRLGGDVRPRPF